LPPHDRDASAAAGEPPRVVRFLGSHAGVPTACYGVVTADEAGIPVEIVDLRGIDAELGELAAGPFAVSTLRRALALAEQVAGEPRAARWDAHRHRLAFDQLAGHLLSPVALSQAELDRGERHILGAGLNYREHRAETGTRSTELLLFPKPVAPTGAFAPVPPVPLLDHEIEIAIVLLADLDLQALPVAERFLDDVAFVLANDVSDREPIILDPKTGYTRGKSRPGHLPLGPWLVAGRHLPLRLAGEFGSMVLDLQLRTKRAAGGPWTKRQEARSTDMITGPLAILQAASARRVGMPDLAGDERFIYPADGVLKAGSLILTGTPGGTAIRAPGALEKLALFVTGGFTRQGAARRYLDMQLEQRVQRGYLAPGDTVEAAAAIAGGGSGLGRQLWRVAEEGPRGRVDDKAAAILETSAAGAGGAG
jgi:2-keto-4-pentenoate hydratase/2-oxohepta-3-ene-1,7-dioic acid hydratase in catechol pathway